MHCRPLCCQTGSVTPVRLAGSPCPCNLISGIFNGKMFLPDRSKNFQISYILPDVTSMLPMCLLEVIESCYKITVDTLTKQIKKGVYIWKKLNLCIPGY